jgi:hypothetical protein
MDKRILKNDFLQIEYLADALRIVGLMPNGKTNLFAELSDLDSPPVPTPYGDFHFLGGHRLWHAPEALPRTYIPDTPLTIIEVPEGVLLESQTEPGAGLRKQILIDLAPDRPSVRITHTLINDGMWSVELAPWAITQFRLGGTVILPLPTGNADPAGLLHNRQFSLWPYARIHDPRLKFEDSFILFKADALLPPFKIGYFNPHCWIAYWLEGILFRKTTTVFPGLPYPDNNCTSEMYCNHKFVELESVGPLAMLPAGGSVSHMETWDIHEGLDSLPEEIQQALGNM